MCLQLQKKTMVRQRKNFLYFLTFVAYVAAGKGTPGVFRQLYEGEESSANYPFAFLGYCWIYAWYVFRDMYLENLFLDHGVYCGQSVYLNPSSMQEQALPC